MHAVDVETVECLRAYVRNKTLAEATQRLGLPVKYKSSLSAILNGESVSRKREGEFRRALGIDGTPIADWPTADLARAIHNRHVYDETRYPDAAGLLATLPAPK